MIYCYKSIYSPDGFSRPCGLPLDEDSRCSYPDHNEWDQDRYELAVLRQNQRPSGIDEEGQ